MAMEHSPFEDVSPIDPQFRGEAVNQRRSASLVGEDFAGEVGLDLYRSPRKPKKSSR